MKLNPVKWHEEPTNAARQYWTAHHGPFTINITYQMFPASNMFPFVQHSWYIVEELEVGSWSRIYWGEEPVGTIENAKAIACLNTLLSLPNQTEDDPFTRVKAKKLLKEW